MQAGLTQPSFGQKFSTMGAMPHSPLKKQPQAGAPRFGRAAESFPYFDTFRPKPKKQKDKRIVQNFYNGVPNEKSGLLSTTIQAAKSFALWALLGYGAYRLTPIAASAAFRGGSQLITTLFSQGGQAIAHGFQAVGQKVSEGAQEVGKNAVKEVTSPRNFLRLLLTAPFLLATNRQMQRR